MHRRVLRRAVCWSFPISSLHHRTSRLPSLLTTLGTTPALSPLFLAHSAAPRRPRDPNAPAPTLSITDRDAFPRPCPVPDFARQPPLASTSIAAAHHCSGALNKPLSTIYTQPAGLGSPATLPITSTIDINHFDLNHRQASARPPRAIVHRPRTLSNGSNSQPPLLAARQAFSINPRRPLSPSTLSLFFDFNIAPAALYASFKDPLDHFQRPDDLPPSPTSPLAFENAPIAFTSISHTLTLIAVSSTVTAGPVALFTDLPSPTGYLFGMYTEKSTTATDCLTPVARTASDNIHTDRRPSLDPHDILESPMRPTESNLAAIALPVAPFLPFEIFNPPPSETLYH